MRPTARTASSRFESERVRPAFSFASDAGVLRFPYVSIIRSLLGSGELRRAKTLLDVAVASGDTSDAMMRLRTILSPPRASVGPGNTQRKAPRLPPSKELSRFEGKWIAITTTGIVAAASTLRELIAATSELAGQETPVIHWVP